MSVMDGFQGPCWLDWWANSVTLLASVEVTVVIAPTPGGWDAHGHLISDSDEDRDGFAFLCQLDPVFLLRFEDGSTVSVTVDLVDETGRFTLTEYTGPAQRPIDIAPICSRRHAGRLATIMLGGVLFCRRARG
jgi:hypothetical protein